MVEASCFQASRVGVGGTAARLGAGPSREEAAAVVTGGAGGDEGAKEALVSAAEAGNEASVPPFTAPPSVRKWKLQEAGEDASAREGGPGQAALPWLGLPACLGLTPLRAWGPGAAPAPPVLGVSPLGGDS